jgi:hypothetical protein
MNKVQIYFRHDNIGMAMWLNEDDADRLLAEFTLGRQRPRLGDFVGVEKNRDWETNEVYETLAQRTVFCWDDVKYVQVTDEATT